MIAKSHEPDNYLTHSRGISSWIFTLDHKRIGVMYLISVLTALFLGGLFAMLIRTQLLDPAGLLFHKTEFAHGLRSSIKPYNQIFTLHGAIMIFLVLIPGIPGGPGKFRPAAHAGGQGRRLPAAEPRAAITSTSAACCFFLASIVLGAVDTGWTFYTPYSMQTSTAVICVVFGRLPAGLQFDPHRAELHRHDP